MKKLLFLFAVSVFSTANALAQTAHQYKLYGSYVDLDGKLIHERADQDYSPAKSLSVSFNVGVDYAPGAYYPRGGKPEEGKILFMAGDDHFFFKKNDADKKQRIEPDHGWSFKVGADSFYVASGFKVYNKFGVAEQQTEETHVLTFIGQSKKFAFFSHTLISGSQNYVVRNLQTNQLTSLPVQQKAFIEKASELFKEYPQLVELLGGKLINSDQVADLMRFIQFSDAFNSDKPIGYTANWDITDKAYNQTYFARVSRPEKNWKLDFYNQSGQKIFTEHYAYAKPTKNDGDAFWYYIDSGVIRKKTRFAMGESSKEFHVYHPNGQLHYLYLINPEGHLTYRAVQSETAESLLDFTGSGKEEFYDETAGRTIIREFQNHSLKASYYLDQQNRKIYQYAQRNAKIRSLNACNTKLAEAKRYPMSAVRAGEEGIVLVRFLVAPNDQIEEYSILRGVSESIDQEVVAILKNTLLSPTFKSGKHAKQEIYQEVIMPVRFSLPKRSVNRYYYHHNPYWMHHMHHMHQPAFIPPTPPAMPR